PDSGDELGVSAGGAGCWLGSDCWLGSAGGAAGTAGRSGSADLAGAWGCCVWGWSGAADWSGSELEELAGAGLGCAPAEAVGVGVGAGSVPGSGGSAVATATAATMPATATPPAELAATFGSRSRVSPALAPHSRNPALTAHPPNTHHSAFGASRSTGSSNAPSRSEAAVISATRAGQ